MTASWHHTHILNIFVKTGEYCDILQLLQFTNVSKVLQIWSAWFLPCFRNNLLTDLTGRGALVETVCRCDYHISGAVKYMLTALINDVVINCILPNHDSAESLFYSPAHRCWTKQCSRTPSPLSKKICGSWFSRIIVKVIIQSLQFFSDNLIGKLKGSCSSYNKKSRGTMLQIPWTPIRYFEIFVPFPANKKADPSWVVENLWSTWKIALRE